MNKTKISQPCKLALAIASLSTLAGYPSMAAAADTFALEEVVVTAQKRAESLQDVPISVSAMSGDKLAEAGIPSFQDFSAYVPNLNVTSNAIGDVISIRGIQSGVLASIEQSVGTYVDGVYRGRGTQSRFSFLDVGMVEVLRGPQGTLFGKNTIGGAMNITSAAPTEEFEAQISAQYEVEHEETELQGYVAGPLTDSLYGRLAILSRDRNEGWVENDYYDQSEPQLDEYAGRVSLAWDASDDLLVKFKYEHGDWDNKGVAFEEYIVDPSLAGAYALLGVPGNSQPADFTTAIGNNIPGSDYGAAQIFVGDSDESALQFDYQLGAGTVTGILGYSAYAFDRYTDADINAFDGIGLEESEDFDQTSLELRYVSELGNGFEYIAGVYWQDANLDLGVKTNFNVDPADGDSLGPLVMASMMASGLAPDMATAAAMVGTIGAYTRAATMKQQTETLAAFAQGTLDLTNDLRLTLGARYGEEERDAKQGVHCADWDTFNINDASCTPLQMALGEFTPHQNDNLHRDEEHWTWNTNLQWDLNEQVMLYANISTGVKSGGFNSWALTTSADEAEFDEEKVKAFEVGAKMSLLDGQAELNVALFDMDYDDLQATIFTGSAGFKVENAASASISGIEMDGRWQLAESLMLRGSLGYVDFEFDDYRNAGCTNAQKAGLGFVGFIRPAVGTTDGVATAVDFDGDGVSDACEQDLSGGTNPFTPELSASLSIEHELDLGEFYLRTVVDANYLDDHHTAQDNDMLAYQDAYTLWNLTLTFGAQDDSWDVSLIGRNLTDEEIITYSNDMPLFAGSQQVAWGREANYAIRGRLKF